MPAQDGDNTELPGEHCAPGANLDQVNGFLTTRKCTTYISPSHLLLASAIIASVTDCQTLTD